MSLLPERLKTELGIVVDIALKCDLEEILALQKHAYKSEAEIYNDFTIPPLIQTLADLEQEAEESMILKVVEDGRIVGSVRALEKDGTCFIGRLIVHPQYQNKGIAKKLMAAVETCFKGARYELFTGHRSEKNLALYEKLGYKRFREEKVNDGLRFVYLEKKAVLIHEMQIDDYSEIYGLWENTPGMGLSDADTHKNIHRFLLRNKGLSFVCRHEAGIIGTILCGHDGRRGYIYHVAVAERYRGRGIGQMLVDKSLRKLKEEEIHKCHIFVFSDNKIGNAFWSSKGWIKREDIFVYSKSFCSLSR